MFPPGRIVFLRPLKVLVKTKSTVDPKASILPSSKGSKKSSSGGLLATLCASFPFLELNCSIYKFFIKCAPFNFGNVSFGMEEKHHLLINKIGVEVGNQSMTAFLIFGKQKYFEFASRSCRRKKSGDTKTNAGFKGSTISASDTKWSVCRAVHNF